MAIRLEFKRRLQKLSIEIDRALRFDSVSRGLLPALFGVFTYMWCKTYRGISSCDKTLDF